MEGVNDLLANGERPDADNPAHRAAVDASFEALSAAFAEHPPKDRASIEDDYVAATGMLPAALRDSLIGGQSPQLSLILPDCPASSTVAPSYPLLPSSSSSSPPPS